MDGPFLTSLQARQGNGRLLLTPRKQGRELKAYALELGVLTNFC